MGLWRRLGVVVVVLVLTTTLFGANLALGVERTVLDAGFVTSTLAEEDVYDGLLDVTRERMVEMGENATGGRDLPISPASFLERVVTPAYLRAQTERNVESVIDYLHGDRDDLEVAVDLRPAKLQAETVITEEIKNMTPAELFGLFEGDADAAAGEQPSLALLARMTENESAYEAARADFRESLVESVVDNRTDAWFEGASDDELLALVIDDYDPDAYDDAEKAAMVDEREAEIRTAIRDRVESEVTAEVDEVLAEERAAIREDLESTLADADVDPALRDAFGGVALLAVDGLTADLSYDEFHERALDTRDTLAEALSSAVLEGLAADVPDEMVLTEELDPAARDGLATARTAVQVLDALAILLWLVALGLVAALWWLSRSVAATALWSGVSLLAAASPVAVAATWATGRLRSLAPTDPTGAAMFDLVLPVVERVTGAITTQSVALALLGLVLVGFGLAIRLDLLTDREPWSDLT